MSYRPLTDVWFLARAKLKGGRKFYGAYLGGFPERARVLIGASLDEPMLHLCGGMARLYPYARGFGPHDQTLDLDPATDPDFEMDAREPLPRSRARSPLEVLRDVAVRPWAGILIDPPYSEADAAKYAPGAAAYPSPSLLIANALHALEPGRKAGIIHYALPRCPKNGKFVAAVGVLCGFQNRIRCFSVFERLP